MALSESNSKWMEIVLLQNAIDTAETASLFRHFQGECLNFVLFNPEIT